MNIKKSIILLFIASVSLTKLYGQYMPKNLPNYDYKNWHFGFTLGVNTMNFNVYPVDKVDYDSTVLIIQPKLSQGFNIGIVANKRIGTYWDLRFVPTLSFGQRNIEYVIRTSPTKEELFTKSVESTFLDIPISVKYKSKRFQKNLNNMRTYVLGGIRYSIDLASQKKKKGSSDEIVLKLNPNDLMITTGVGFDFYLAYFKFGVELQFAYGLINVLDKEETIYTTNMEKLSSRMAWITFTFE
ncbi:MAG: hypothetical protein DRI86_07305 [Bacteroidetes bacterium]|nr:MAG: hypothetical protein DRI86_07305 [Bacteroidota bacterium]